MACSKLKRTCDIFLSEECLFCKKNKFVSNTYSKARHPLLVARDIDTIKKIIAIAKEKGNEQLASSIQNESRIRYHKICYRNFTRNVSA